MKYKILDANIVLFTLHIYSITLVTSYFSDCMLNQSQMNAFFKLGNLIDNQILEEMLNIGSNYWLIIRQGIAYNIYIYV